MQKLVSFVYALVILAVVSGCGSKTTASTVILPTKVILTSTDVSGKTFYSTSINGSKTSINGIAVYQINQIANNVQTAAWSSSPSNPLPPPTDINGTWSTSAAGTLVLTLPDTTIAHQFTCIQKEKSYFLMSDESGNIIRFYFDSPSGAALVLAQTYLN